MCWGDGDDEEEGEENAVVHVAEDISAGAGFLDQQHVKTKDTVGYRRSQALRRMLMAKGHRSIFQHVTAQHDL